MISRDTEQGLSTCVKTPCTVYVNLSRYCVMKEEKQNDKK